MYSKIVLRIFVLYDVYTNIISVNAFKSDDAKSKGSGMNPITDHDWLNNIVPSSYDQTISPARFMNDNSTGIMMNLLPICISDISEKNMHFEVEMQIIVSWKEPRLPYGEIENRSSLIFVSPPRAFLNQLWNPHIIFTNCKLCDKERQIGHSRIEHLNVFLNVRQETILLIYRQTLKFSCYFDLHKYPLDSHICDIYVELLVLRREKSYLFLRYEPYKNYSPSHYVQKFIPGQYNLVDVKIVNKCSDLNPISTNSLDNECIRISFQFDRLIYNELMLLYLPSTFIVIISWLSFWMDVGASAPRVALGLTSLLTLSTQFTNAQNNLPPVSYVKAIDMWMLTCSFMVFSSLVEYFISYQLQDWKMVSRKGKENYLSPCLFRILKKNRVEVRRMNQFQKKIYTSTTKIDFISRILFPVIFLIFNIAYWIYYA